MLSVLQFAARAVPVSLSLIHATPQTSLSAIAMFVRVMRPLPEVVADPGYRSSYVARHADDLGPGGECLAGGMKLADGILA
jgi:hypothetical protein